MASGRLWAVVAEWFEGGDRRKRSRRAAGVSPPSAFGSCHGLASLGLMAGRNVEALEDRALLDGDPYGGYGGGGSSGSGGSGGGGGGGMGGSYSGTVTGGLLKPNGQEWFETFGTDPLSGVVAVVRDLPGGLQLSYSSDSAVTKPIVNVEATWTNT